eukprot:CAMPEP_0197353480 /NCGR_PEP_ID=MMETSP0893-20130614/39692_1 /TAXON_ID=44058 ORGANISM="Aureoumbra lagunensis, Strain CCMP1510" /NCGR_SAMPLE_ID=MMETSP0893 /ASSEMBLY_ACC=CAM_ASM_000539 /LENGTH=178 /DNA_ID=CAMNT_0042868813 /DNA_START=29 /DNA_END=565 /DNA_ORIENTATION=-
MAIALLMTIDEDIATMDFAGRELAEKIASKNIDCVASAATLGILLGATVAKELQLPRQYVLQKTMKTHLSDALIEPLNSITTKNDQALRLDRRWLSELNGKRVAFVDDVISSGSSCAAALRLLRAAGAEVVAIAAILVEADGWRTKLGQEDANLVSFLAKIPIFRRDNEDAPWQEVWD